jgi:uncharacterized protein (DUF1330 family)
MPAYLIAAEVINDREEFDKYRALVHDVLEKYGGETIVANEEVEVVEGNWPYTKTVVIRFPSMEEAKRWYYSKEYQSIIQHRLAATDTDLIFVEGRA